MTAAAARARRLPVPGYLRARAPLRVSFCGGGTDVSPYPEEHGGMVLSATINQYAYASLRPRRDTRVTLASLDYDVVARYDHPRQMRKDGTLDLIKTVVRHFKPPRGADLWVHSDAPPGSGLGSSFPHGYFLPSVPRAAFSRSASVGSRPPAHSQYAFASSHVTKTAG